MTHYLKTPLNYKNDQMCHDWPNACMLPLKAYTMPPVAVAKCHASGPHTGACCVCKDSIPMLACDVAHNSLGNLAPCSHCLIKQFNQGCAATAEQVGRWSSAVACVYGQGAIL